MSLFLQETLEGYNHPIFLRPPVQCLVESLLPQRAGVSLEIFSGLDAGQGESEGGLGLAEHGLL